jgi:hypothetical protein
VKRVVERARRHPWLALGVTVAALAIGGLAVAASGILPLKASAGHWQVTSWLLHFTMRRSVSTHALMIDAPSLDDPALVGKGAAHYDLGCRPCHGTPRGDRLRPSHWRCSPSRPCCTDASHHGPLRSSFTSSSMA